MNDKSSATEQSDGAKVRLHVCTKGSSGWTTMNIVGLVASFVFFGPLGLAVLFWILSGRNVSEIPGAIARAWTALRNMKDSGEWNFGFAEAHGSDNVVFNEYQQTQFDRIQEIREDIRRRRSRFDEFRADVKRRADEDEFRRFMNESPLRGES